MKKVIFILSVLFFMFSNAGFGEKLTTLTEVMKPNGLVVDDEWIYVTEGTAIFIYAKKDLTMKKKFGKAGEGPGEFLTFVDVNPQEDHLIINSLGKISYFTRDGVFRKELRARGGISNTVFLPLEKGFVGLGFTQEEGIQYATVNFYDQKLDKGKELYRMKTPAQQSGKIEFPPKSFVYQVLDNRIYVIGKEGFTIDVLDHTGNLHFSIGQKNYKRRKFTAEDEKQFRDALKLRMRGTYEQFKNRLAFPDYFPEILSFFAADKKLYVATWKRDDGKTEFFIFDPKGKLIKHVFIPLAFQDILQPFPAAIKGGQLYQLIENEDEEWQLHASPIEY
jgi:hypothetical protein